MQNENLMHQKHYKFKMFSTIEYFNNITITKLPLPIHIQYNKLCDTAKNTGET
ncbi:hypothetical protein SAMN05421768_101692 [Chryseobacterium joostei]|uniref:Uncharacterized protein n=1 Tax=Chryseobacterium joostei TaxID=112234 RepID=A0A1N7HXJ8_9FLAO|nr:hypothetical protein SAMN05421768_101692 [Chryseobacterium joostei]